MPTKITHILFIALFFIYSCNKEQNTEALIDEDTAKELFSDAEKKIVDNEIEKAINQLKIVAEYGKKANDVVILLESYDVTAYAYDRLKMYDKAELYFKDSIFPLLKGKSNLDKERTDFFLNNYGTLLLHKGDTIGALEKFNKHLENKAKNNDTTNISATLLNIGTIELKRKNYAKAKPYFEKSIHYLDFSKSYASIFYIDMIIPLAKIAVLNNEYSVALDYLKTTDSAIAKKYNRHLKIERIKVDVYKKTNNTKKHLESLELLNKYLEDYKIKKDSDIKKNNDLVKRFYEKEQEIKTTNAQNQIQKSKLQFSRLIIFIILFFLAVTSIILFLLNKSNSTKKRLNDVLKSKNLALTKSKEKAEYASKLKENFFSTISHELRTPLYTVTGITDILINDEPMDKKYAQYLKTLKSSGEHLLDLINNVLQINKLDANKIKLNIIDFDLRILINSIKESLSYLNRENDNQIHIVIDETVPNQLQGDSLKIKQVLVNLLSNALKFTKNGNIWIIINTIEKTTNYILLDVKVKDDGIGISKEFQAQVFEDFYQESMKLDRNYEGTGLGLAIVKRLLLAMNSEINVESVINKGATFFFNLKLKIPKQKNILKEEKNKSSVNFTNKRFLVVDDNTVNLMITKRILESKNANITLAKDGFEALEKINEANFDLILMDIQMPKMNGYTATKKIRSFNTTVPILALTAVTLEENIPKAMKSGMNGIITKPYVIEDFFNKIEKVLQ